MNSTNIERWRKYWSDKDDPLHHDNTDEYYDLMSEELLILLPDVKGKKVLELGCGNGVFFQRLGFSESTYLGLDLSEAMIEKFKNDHPGTNLMVTSAHDFSVDEEFDLIFSNGMIQGFTVSEFDEHLRLAANMLKTGGIILHAAAPWDIAHWTYNRGYLNSRSSRPFLRSLAGYIAKRLGIRNTQMGTWYNVPEVRRIARKHGLDSEIFGSILYPYRFHMRFQHQGHQ